MKHTRILLLIALLGAAAVGLPSLRGATITVTEVGDGLDVHTNLRQALADANDGDTIEFAPQLGGYTLGLIRGLGELVVNKSVTISWVPQAGYPTYLGVSPWYNSRVFYISPGKTVTISGLTILNGSVPPPEYRGSGIYNDHADLTLRNCTISGNSAENSVGGAIYSDEAILTVSHCTISGNYAWLGGGIATNWWGNGSATVTITNSTISGNSADYGGGGIYNGAGTTLAIVNCTLSGNSAYWDGGGIFNGGDATLTMTNSTLSGNSIDPAGEEGGGIYNVGGTLKIGNTILNAGSSGANIYNAYDLGTVTSLGYNLSSDNGGGYLTAIGDQITMDPRLGPLQDNGGPTFTHVPASDSPAIDGSDPALSMDQRGPGFARVVNGRADIGAVEVQAAPTATPRPHGRR
jgi:Right handed beta helix region